jgi:hypothetical protein
MAGLARQEVAAEDVVANADATAEARPVRTKEAIVKEVTAVEVIAPRTATDGTAAGEITTVEASSGQAGQCEPRKIMEEATGEASTGVETLEPPEIAARANSNVVPAPGTETGTPVPETG